MNQPQWKSCRQLNTVCSGKALVLATLCFLVTGGAHAADEGAFARGREIGKYVAETEGRSQSVRRALEYCGEKFPEHESEFNSILGAWDKRNAAVAGSWRTVARNWLIADGLAADADRLVALLETVVPDILASARKQDYVARSFSHLATDKLRPSCGWFAVTVDAGGRDIRGASPWAYQLYEKYGASRP